MAGHSKWSKVKHIKGPLDQKRGQLFSKLAKEITVAAKMGGGDPGGNPRLRSAILSARAQSMPNDNIERAIRRGTGEGGEAVNYEEMVYEAYAPGGVALIIEAATDNKNRTAAELRLILSKLTFVPETHVTVTDEQTAAQVLRLIHALEASDDVQNIHANFDAPEELLAKVG
jgi:YebC/PmpR family DNA-binding regulatory protein